MHGAVNRGWLAANVLHDVDLARLRPSNGVDVVAEHPECGPDSLSAGNFYSRLESSICLSEFSRGLETRRRVATRSVPALAICVRRFLESRDDKIPASIERNVFSARSIVLAFLVAPPFTASFRNPLRCVERCTGCAFEFIAPRERPLFSGCAGCRR